MKTDEIIAIIDRSIAPPMSKRNAQRVLAELIEWLEANLDAITEEIRREEQEALKG
jgi:hypothetical protein